MTGIAEQPLHGCCQPLFEMYWWIDMPFIAKRVQCDICSQKFRRQPFERQILGQVLINIETELFTLARAASSRVGR